MPERFEDAARAEYPYYEGMDLTQCLRLGDKRRAFISGAEWLSEQEPTDAEVQAFREAAMDEGLLVGSSVARRILASVRDARKEQSR